MNSIILFDGACNLCNASVNFIIDHDVEQKFYFTSIQSDYAQKIILNPSTNYKLYTPKGLLLLDNRIIQELNSLNSILYFENNIFYTKSDAALRIAKDLNGIVRLISIGKFLPRFLRDSIYNWIARNRYQWFGKTESCRMPTPELKKRFLG